MQSPPASVLTLMFALATMSMAAESPTPAEKAAKAAANLSRGCIVTATQTDGAAPTFALAGKQEPAGVPTEKIIFEIGSISKVFTGLLLAQAVIERKVTLDTTLREMMGPRQAFADPQVAAITLRQLATHTSGLPRLPDDIGIGADPADPYAHYDRARLDAGIARLKLAHAPPFDFAYSNLGVGLLGDLLARLYGSDWEKLVVDRISKPLGLPDTCVTLTREQERRLAPPYASSQPVKRWRMKALAGAGALHSTATDLLRFGQALDKPETTPLKESLEMIRQPQGGEQRGLGLAIAKTKGGTEYWSQGGTGGYGSWVSANAVTHGIIVILINNNEFLPEKVLFDQLDAAPKAPADPALAGYVGAYDTGVKAGATDILYTFEARGSDLWLQITGQPFIPLTRHPSKTDRFEFKPVKAEIQFTRKKDEVISTTLFQDGLEIRAKKLPAKK